MTDTSFVNNDVRYDRRVRRQARLLELVSNGLTIHEALADGDVGVTYDAYRQWRKRDKSTQCASSAATNPPPTSLR
jgi:hypothetical protein